MNEVNKEKKMAKKRNEEYEDLAWDHLGDITAWLQTYASDKYGYDDGDEIEIIELVKKYLESDAPDIEHIKKVFNQGQPEQVELNHEIEIHVPIIEVRTA